MVTTPTTSIDPGPDAPPAAPDSTSDSAQGSAPERRRKSRGQSLAEFALTVPFALFMVLFGLDFGRVFLGWVSLNQAAREAANYAAMNPTAWTLPYNLAVQTEYARLVAAEAASINCVLESPVSEPFFDDGTSIGAPATVELTCQFGLLTPFIGLLLGNPIPVSASSAFPIRAGTIEGIPVEPELPSASPGPTVSATPTDTPAPTESAGASAAPTPTAGASVGPSAGPTPTPAPTPTTCTVVSLLNIQTSKAAAKWKAAGFTGAVIFSPLVPPNYRILWQSLSVGTTNVLCTSGITVRSRAP